MQFLHVAMYDFARDKKSNPIPKREERRKRTSMCNESCVRKNHTPKAMATVTIGIKGSRCLTETWSFSIRIL
jgi:hypothetical protein